MIFEDDDRIFQICVAKLNAKGSEAMMQPLKQLSKMAFSYAFKFFYCYVDMQQVYTISTPAFFSDMFCVVRYANYLSNLLWAT